VDHDSRHNRILKQELRRYGPRSISPKESPFRALFGAFYPHPAHKSSPRAEWATHTGHCSPASHPTPNQRGEVVRRPSPAGYCLPPTAEFPMNFPARSRGRGPLVGHWSGRRWHNFPFPGSWSGTRCGDVFYSVQPISPGSYHEFTIRLGLTAGWEPDRSSEHGLSFGAYVRSAPAGGTERANHFSGVPGSGGPLPFRSWVSRLATGNVVNLLSTIMVDARHDTKRIQSPPRQHRCAVA
jgi:hypothetical protein